METSATKRRVDKILKSCKSHNVKLEMGVDGLYWDYESTPIGLSEDLTHYAYEISERLFGPGKPYLYGRCEHCDRRIFVREEEIDVSCHACGGHVTILKYWKTSPQVTS